ncbi:hypothetical protein LCY76_20690 [Fictibacillus sp. KIGAM418]|uniref:Phosphoribulokinase/uridine kinase domain-containing protein n=1 Tax=Fictibacillus marinisediminis TaxID=2878389 RepID=A0A9X1XEI1_9BACL|nr:hypothetical protein [Fictibacillus marinisediminis]MCK6258993.1 hypothetical protein [Fictibacillus marinisediminis]
MTLSQDRLINNLCSLIIKQRSADTPLIVGITGIDTSGKTQLTYELHKHLQTLNESVQIVHVDDFHNPKSKRYVPDLPEADQYYNLSINFDELVTKVLNPIKDQGQLQITLNHLDILSDSMSLQKEYSIFPNSIVLLEGVFLFRPETYPFIDFSIFLNIDEDTALQRAAIRDVPTQGEEVLNKYHTKYFPAQRTYLQIYRPDLIADVVIDNSDWTSPIVAKWPSLGMGEVYHGK